MIVKGALSGETPCIIYTVEECYRGVENEGNDSERGCGFSTEKERTRNVEIRAG